MKEIDISTVEAVVFIKSQGISIKDISKILGMTEEKILGILLLLQKKYSEAEHGVELAKNEDRFIFQIKPEIKRLVTPKPRKLELTASQFEVLAILYLNGPSRLSEVEKSRGRNSYTQLLRLKELGLVKKVKKANTKSLFLYTLSDNFFEWLSQDTIKKLEEIKDGKITGNSTESGTGKT